MQEGAVSAGGGGGVGGVVSAGGGVGGVGGGRLEVTSQLKQRDVITRGLSRPRSGGRDGRPVAAVKSNLLSEGEGGGSVIECMKGAERVKMRVR